VGCQDLVEIPDHLELLDHLDHQANEDLRVTPDQREHKDLREVVGRMVHQDNKVWSASRDQLEQLDGSVHLAARVQTVYRVLLVLQALKDHTEILVFLVGRELLDRLDHQDL